MKPLSEMTLEELWELFPIILTGHNPNWKNIYLDEKKLLEQQLSGFHFLRISHIGSTAVENIAAKPIIDILVEIGAEDSFSKVAELIVKCGYIKMSEYKNHMSFNKGYTQNGFAEKVYHLHLRFKGDNDELYFRDYLNDNPDAAAEYEQLKLSIWKKFEHDRDGYTEAKTDFVKNITRKAKTLYINKY